MVAVFVLSAVPVDTSRRQQVLTRLEDARRARPTSGELALRLGMLHEAEGRFDDAEAQYRDAIVRAERPSVALNNLAWLLAFRPGRADEALRMVDRAVELSGPLPDLLDTRGVVELALKQPGKAATDLRLAVASSPGAVRFYHLSQAYLAAGDRRNAREAFDRAVAAGLGESALHPLERGAFAGHCAGLGLK
ncbi:MAG: hypothetical protein U0835_08555 [Isosphaeraceae bacterium]